MELIVTAGKLIINISECIKIEEEYLVDLNDVINIDSSFCLNESKIDSGKLIYKSIEKMHDKDHFVCSNEDDPELLFYIPFKSQVDIKSMTMIGGENGTAPLHIKLYTNQENPDFSLLEQNKFVMEFECSDNIEGEIYELKPNKFKSVTSLTLIVCKNHGANHSKVYYLSFTGTRTRVSFFKS